MSELPYGGPDLTLRYGRTPVIEGNSEHSVEASRFARTTPHFGWEYEPGKHYALVMHHRPTSKVHLFVINAKNGSLERAEVLHSHRPPEAPGEYELNVYEQSGPVKLGREKQPAYEFDEVEELTKGRRFTHHTTGRFSVAGSEKRTMESMTPPDVRRSPGRMSPTRRYSPSKGGASQAVRGLEGSKKLYAGCVVDVTSKQSAECLADLHEGKTSSIGKRLGGTICVNPYAVCAHNTHTTAEIEQHLVLERLTDEELVGEARREGLTVPRTRGKVDRNKLIAALKEHLAEKKKLPRRSPLKRRSTSPRRRLSPKK